MEFHISRRAREQYQFDETLFSFNGNVILADFQAARRFAQKMNLRRDLARHPEKVVRAGEINAMGLIDEILHLVAALYRRQKNPQVLDQALAWLEARIGKANLDRTLLEFVREFPPLPVYRNHISPEDYLKGQTAEFSHRAATLEEMLLLWVNNRNPALDPYLELFDEEYLRRETAYAALIRELYQFFETQPTFGPDNQHLMDMMRAPAIAHPNSLFEQLDYIRQRWGYLLGEYLTRLLKSLDLLKEEQKSPFLGPGPVEIPTYAHLEGEPEAFSPDREWMPRLVLIAKNTYVWLDQLSKKYGQPIQRLDQIPDEELDTLARWGISGLWLIGIWERSRASARIKQLCGNPEAIASAYSLAEYRVADDLGGETAYQNLRDRAWQRGIRLASDMVPNHMGIDSRWVIEHPDWFIGLDYSPFPSYTFNGPDLSSDPRVGIFLEDHYYDRTDAAVVFKRVDYTTGDIRYIYHGNDGTSMPWNDTAQLNYLKPEVREAVMQTILEVARKFPIIRFDAAMTLTKRHYQRLWFPEPGSGGAIPSRAEHGLTKQEFDRLMPNEFWREVVDRVAQEAPDTLLLAEAFWLMEGYFVRTLGMHRVYNSAFMNMLRNEENANYRTLIKNTLEFEPEILKRYVNFMNNPDERTAVEQFGKGDKYFGVCTLMCTLPGLPMFGHGQIEGFAEKYGMEFRRAYWDEMPDLDLIARHERQIFPLLHRRALFAGVENFLLYDFYTPEGYVNEDVFAFSNRLGDESALVIYHNRFAETRGWIKTSVGFLEKKGAKRHLVQRSLGEGLGLSRNPNTFVIYRDLVDGLEYLQPTSEIHDKGLYFELNAYQTHVFLDFREVTDDVNGTYRRLWERLQGRGTPSLWRELQQIRWEPIWQPLREIYHPGYLRYLLQQRITQPQQCLPVHLLDEAQHKLEALLRGIETLTGYRGDWADILSNLKARLNLIMHWPVLEVKLSLPTTRRLNQALQNLQDQILGAPERWLALLCAAFSLEIGRVKDSMHVKEQTLEWLETWQVPHLLSETAKDLGLTPEQAQTFITSFRILIAHQDWYDEDALSRSLSEVVANWLADPEIQSLIGLHSHEGVLWFHKEGFETLVALMQAIGLLAFASLPTWKCSPFYERVLALHHLGQSLHNAATKAGYQLEAMMKYLQSV